MEPFIGFQHILANSLLAFVGIYTGIQLPQTQWAPKDQPGFKPQQIGISFRVSKVDS